MEDDEQDSKTLVVMEDESTSPESRKLIKYEVLKTISKMAPLDDIHEEFKTKEVTPISKVEECIIWLNKEIEAFMVIHIEKNKKIKRSGKIMCLRSYWSTNIGSLEWMEKEITNLSVVGRVEADSTKIEQLLGRQLKKFFSSFFIFSFVVYFRVILSLCNFNSCFCVFCRSKGLILYHVQ